MRSRRYLHPSERRKQKPGSDPGITPPSGNLAASCHRVRHATTLAGPSSRRPTALQRAFGSIRAQSRPRVDAAGSRGHPNGPGGAPRVGGPPMVCVSSPRSEIVRSAGRLSFPQTPTNTRTARRVPEVVPPDFPRPGPDPPLTPKPAPASLRNPRSAGPRGGSLDAAQGPPTLGPPARGQHRSATGVVFLGIGPTPGAEEPGSTASGTA